MLKKKVISIKHMWSRAQKYSYFKYISSDQQEKKKQLKTLEKVVGGTEWEIMIWMWRELKYSVIYEGLIEGKKQYFLKP